MNTTTNAELLRAVSVICDAACGNRCSRSDAVAAAHRTVIEQRAQTTGSIRNAVNTYLDPATWAQGPFVLRNAICQLARELDLPVHDELDNVVEQLSLFDG